MKTLAFVIGVGIGFLIGSRAGSGPYAELEQKVRALRRQPEVESAVEHVKEAASRQVTDVVDKVNDKVNEKVPPPSTRVSV